MPRDVDNTSACAATGARSCAPFQFHMPWELASPGKPFRCAGIGFSLKQVPVHAYNGWPATAVGEGPRGWTTPTPQSHAPDRTPARAASSCPGSQIRLITNPVTRMAAPLR
jgi:hypothetical protein